MPNTYYQNDNIVIFRDKAKYNKSPYGSDKEVLFVHFRKLDQGNLWMPKYQELIEIFDALNDVEKISWRDAKCLM